MLNECQVLFYLCRCLILAFHKADGTVSSCIVNERHIVTVSLHGSSSCRSPDIRMGEFPGFRSHWVLLLGNGFRSDLALMQASHLKSCELSCNTNPSTRFFPCRLHSPHIPIWPNLRCHSSHVQAHLTFITTLAMDGGITRASR